MTEATVSVSVPAGRLTDESRSYTPAQLLEVALAAYERGLLVALSQAGRDQWNDPELHARLRAQRIAADTARMKACARRQYRQRGLPAGYDYRGGPVDWATGMPAGSACGWLRRTQRSVDRVAA
jgi:hypothetical protein